MNRPWLTLPATLVLAAAMSGCSPQAIQAVNTALAAVNAAQAGAIKPVASPKTSPKPKKSAEPASEDDAEAGDADATDEDAEATGAATPKPAKTAKPGTSVDDDAEEDEDGEGEDDEPTDEGEDGDEDDGDNEEGDGDDEEDDADCAVGFAEVDTNRDRDVSLNEYIVHEGDPDAEDPDDEREALTEAFDALDDNGDGVLTDDEYCPAGDE